MDECLAAQEQLFDYRQSGGQDGARAPAVGGSLVGRGCGEERPEASLREGTVGERPRDFVNRRLDELAARKEKPVVLGEEQKDVLAVVARKVEEVVESEGLVAGPPGAAATVSDEGGTGAPVEQAVILLLGQGGSGKTEVTGICREMFERFSRREAMWPWRRRNRRRA